MCLESRKVERTAIGERKGIAVVPRASRLATRGMNWDEKSGVSIVEKNEEREESGSEKNPAKHE